MDGGRPRIRGWATTSRLDRFVDPLVGVVAATWAVVALLMTDERAVDPRLEPPGALAVLLTAAAGLALAWRRTRPRASFVVLLAGSALVSLTGHFVGSLSVLLPFGLYSLTAHGRRRDALVGLGASVTTFVVLALLGVPDLRTADLVAAVAILVASWGLGEAIRSRRERHAEQLRVAEQEAVAAREHAARAASEERLRIARELHDVVAHGLSLIAVQAGVGAHVMDRDPAAARRSLDVIAESSRRALEQTRSLLGVLREADERGDRPPTQSLEDLDSLVADVVAAGVEVELDRTGTPGSLDPVLALTAYRVVQESLTNVVRHSAAGCARVAVDVGPDGALVVEVADPGPARPRTADALPPGHGLAGLSERVGLVGGRLTAGGDGAGFRVRAELPGRPRATVGAR